MDKTIFGVEEIHEARVEMSTRRAKMPPADALRERDERIAAGKRRIEELRNAKQDAKLQAQ